MTDDTSVKVRLLFVDEGSYHHEDIDVPAEALERYDRLVDVLQEEPAVLRSCYVDLARLCAAHLVGDEEG